MSDYYSHSLLGFVNLVFIIFLVIPALCFGQNRDTLFVSLDMREPILEGWLDPTAEVVGLRGDHPPLSWGSTYKATDPDGDGIYKAAIPFSFKGRILQVALKIKVDGADNPDDGWQAGRNHQVVIQQDNRDTLSLKWDDRAAPPPSTITGQVEVIKNFESGKLPARDIYIYLPPGYSGSQKRYPVLYMHDGQNLFDAAASGQEWKLDETAQQLIKNGSIEPLIIVGIGNTEHRMDEYTPTRQHWEHKFKRTSAPADDNGLGGYTGSFVTQNDDSLHLHTRNDTLLAMIPGGDRWQSLTERSDSAYYLPGAGITFHFHGNSDQPVSRITASKPPIGGQGEAYADFILNNLKPFIDDNLLTRTDPKWTGLGGSSLGGLITLYIGLKHPKTFGKLIVSSPSVWWDNRMILDTVRELPGPTAQHIWLDIGTAEGEQSVENVRDLKNALLQKGWSDSLLHYEEADGAAHNERAWAERVPEMLQFLFPKQEIEN